MSSAAPSVVWEVLPFSFLTVFMTVVGSQTMSLQSTLMARTLPLRS